MTDTYEGWSNRETWAANLWLSNDEGLYLEVREIAARTLEGRNAHEARYVLGEALSELFEEFAHGEGEDGYVPAPGIYKMLADIGSLYRVDWHEIAEGWVADAEYELTRGGGR